MSNKQLFYQYHNQIRALIKIINSWRLIPGASKDEFDTMAIKILNHLQKGAEIEKFKA